MIADGQGGESREELEAYLATIEGELKKREERLLAVQEKLSRLESEIGAGGKRPSGRAIDGAAMSSHQAFLKSLRRKAESLRAEHGEAAAEVAKARERKKVVEEELRALDEGGGAGEG